MFELENQSVVLKEFRSLLGKRDENKQPERSLNLLLTMVESASYLSEVNPRMRSAFYKKDDSPDIIGSDELTRLALPEIKGFIGLEGEFVGATVIIGWGIGSEIELADCKVYGLKFQPQEGGTCLYSFQVRTSEATGRDVGTIFETLHGQQIEITIKAPQSPNLEIDMGGSE